MGVALVDAFGAVDNDLHELCLRLLGRIHIFIIVLIIQLDHIFIPTPQKKYVNIGFKSSKMQQALILISISTS